MRIGDAHLRIRSAYESAWWAAYFGATDEPVEKLEQTIRLAEAEDDLGLRIGGQLRLGMMLVNRARLEEAEAPLSLCAALASELGSVRNAARATHQLGLIKLFRGDLEASEQLLLQADEWLRRTEDTNFLIQNLRALGMHALATGAPVVAEERLRPALPLARDYGGYFAAEIARLLVDSLLRQGRLVDAHEIAAPALAEVADEDAAALAAARTMQGSLAAVAGDLDAVRASFGEALQALDGIGAPMETRRDPRRVRAGPRHAGRDGRGPAAARARRRDLRRDRRGWPARRRSRLADGGRRVRSYDVTLKEIEVLSDLK